MPVKQKIYIYKNNTIDSDAPDDKRRDRGQKSDAFWRTASVLVPELSFKWHTRQKRRRKNILGNEVV